MTTLYVQVPGTRGMVRIATIRTETMKNRSTRNIVSYAKRLAVMAAGIDGHGYAEVWERCPRKCIYAVRHKNR